MNQVTGSCSVQARRASECVTIDTQSLARRACRIGNFPFLPLDFVVVIGHALVDVHSKSQRSFNMSRIRSKDTKPEMMVRSIVHAMGYRYRLHDRSLPGKPDLVFRAARKVIFVHGCFWHCHRCRYGRVVPATNTEFWQTKRQGNVDRDRRNRRQLQKDGWQVLVIWECWTRDPEKQLFHRLKSFLSN